MKAKNIFFFILIALLTSASLAKTQWVQTNGLEGAGTQALAISGNNIFVGTIVDGVFHSTDNGSNWNAVNTGLPSTAVLSLTSSGNNIFVGLNGGWEVYRSTNNGANWNAVNNGLPSTNVLSFAISENNIFAGTYENGVYLSTNNGSIWNAVNNGLPTNIAIRSLAINGSNIFAGTFGGVFLSTDNGSNWSAVNAGLPNNVAFVSLAINGANIFAGTWCSGVYLSTNNGSTWNSVNNGVSVYIVRTITISPNNTGGTNVFMGVFNYGGGGGVYLSTNNGSSWNAVTNGIPTGIWINSFSIIGNNIFAGTGDLFGKGIESGVYLSTNNGSNWQAVNTGFAEGKAKRVKALAISSNNIFAGTSNGVWRRPLSDFGLTGVEDEENNLPTSFSLQQNYPNPFNPTTTINYSIPQTRFVKISIYDMLGREVAVLVNEDKSAGNYSIIFNGSNLTSGVYLYRMQAGGFVETKKLIK
jgi:hypothetical protein